MKRKLNLLLLLSFCFVTDMAIGQKLTIEGVRKAYLRNAGEILENNEVRGYYFFYQSDKIDKKTNEYTVQITDENANKVKDIKFQDGKDIELLESSYNGNTIMFLFKDDKEKTLEYRAYGFDGKQKFTYTKELNKRSNALIDDTYGSKSEDGQNEALFDIHNIGYVTVYPVKEKKYFSYEVNMFFTSQRKQWTYEAAEEQDDRWASAVYLGNTDSLVLFEIVKQKTILGGNPHSWLLGLNMFTGKKAFEIKTELEDYKFYPMNITSLQGKSEYLVLGSYYEPDAKIMKDKNLGIATWTMDSKGNVLAKKYNSWDGEIGKYLDIDKRGRVKNVGFIYFHKIFQSADGRIFAVGEGYEKVVSGLGTAAGALAMLGGGRSNIAMFKIRVTDLLLMEFDPNFKIANATVYDKNSNSVEMPSGASYLSPHAMALLVRAFGEFDYSYTKQNSDRTEFVVGYSDYEKSKDFKGVTFNTISQRGNKISTDKLQVSSKASRMRLFPAKTGFVGIYEYFKKDKRLEFRIEKMN
ncbi:MAG: DUF6770 family protein [Ferruginibacter sp.]